jgi:hypothetical protein
MRYAIAIYLVSWFVMAVYAGPHGNRTALAAIDRAKKTIVSSFDPALPNLTLESFLDYETEHAPIDWIAADCGKASAQTENGVCVQASATVDPERRVSVHIRVSSDPSAAPKLISVEVLEGGLVHSIKLIELPAATHGRKFRSPPLHDDTPLILRPFAAAHG